MIRTDYRLAASRAAAPLVDPREVYPLGDPETRRGAARHDTARPSAPKARFQSAWSCRSASSTEISPRLNAARTSSRFPFAVGVAGASVAVLAAGAGAAM